MNFKKIRLISVTFITTGLILMFLTLKPGFSSADFSLYEFSKGMLAGMSSVAAVIWLYLTISSIIKSKRNETSPLENHGKSILLSSGLFVLLLGTILSTFFSNNPLLLVTGTLIMCVAMILNTINIKEKIRRYIFGK